MTFRDFIDASYALFTEDQQRVNPLTSLLSISEALTPQKAEPPKSAPARKQDVAAQNDANLNLLTAAMSGTRGKGPMMGGRKKRG